jgi:peptidyl-prolyl cis-trans isomerase SurA
MIITLITVFVSLSSEVIDRIVAVVGDEVILKSEVDQVVEHQRYTSRFGFDEKSFRESVMNEMISSKVLYYSALQDSTISVTDEEVQRILDNRINSIIQQVGSEEKFEEMYNTTVSDLKKQYRPDIKKSLFIEKIRNKQIQKVSVSRDDVEKFYEDYKDSLPPVKASVVLSQLVIRFSDKALNETKSSEFLKDLKSRILRNELSFEEAAEKYSHDEASSSKKGNVGLTNRGDLVADYERAAYNMNPGDISDPVKSPFGYHLILLKEKTGEKINTSHILVVPEKNVENDSTAYQFALNLKDSVLNKKMTFEEAVRKYSGDEKTKYLDGSIGPMELDEMDKKYFDIFKEASIGFMSDPIKEKDGYYIYKITDRKEDHKITPETDYNILKNLAQDRKGREQLKKWIDELKKNVYIDVKY